MEERRIVLLGKTGIGKSSLANTILSQRKFKTRSSPMACTQECAGGERVIDGENVRVFDTPGFYDNSKTSTDPNAEILKSLKLCAPGPHAFLLVFKVDRFTTQEENVVKEMLRFFSKDALNYTTVVFTHGNQLDDGTKIEDWASENETLKTLIEKCGGRIHVFDNRYWDNTQDPYRNNENQVRALLNTINETVKKNGGKYYTNGFWQWIKSIEVFGLPLHVLLGVILGGIAFSVVGGGVAVAANASYVKTISVVSGLCGGVAGGKLVVYLDEDFDPGPIASNALRKLGLKESKDKDE